MKNAVHQCENKQPNAEYCATVQRARVDFSGLYDQWQQGQEEFGRNLLKLEMSHADLSAFQFNFSQTLTQDQMIAAYYAVLGLNPIG